MDCPICPYRNVPEDAKVCPNCAADLEPIRRVRALAASWPVAVPPPRASATGWYVAAALGVLTLGLLATAARRSPPPVETGAQPAQASKRESAPARSADPVPAPAEKSTSELAARLEQVTGLVVAKADEGLLVGFAEPLFLSGSATVGAAQAALVDRVAAILETPSDRAVWVRGYTDPKLVRPGGRWAGNEALALARALTIASRFSRGGQQPVSISAAVEGTPFHDPKSSSRSRTVVLYVTAKKSDPFSAGAASTR